MFKLFIIFFSSFLIPVTNGRGYITGALVGSTITNHYDGTPAATYQCIGQGAYLKKYIYFSENNASDSYYAIKTPWIILHSKRVRDRLVSYGAYVYKSNPSTKCNWEMSYDYDWSNDYVLTKGNRTEQLNTWALEATKATVSLEWFLIFSFIWAPLLVGFIVLCVTECPMKSTKSEAPKLDQFSYHTTIDMKPGNDRV